MNEFLAASLSYPTIIFTTLLCFAMFYWLLSMVGAVGVDSLDFDADIDFDVDADIDVDVDAKGEGRPGVGEAAAGAGFIRKSSLRIIPLSIALTFFFFFGWIICHSVTMLFGDVLNAIMPHVVWGSLLFISGTVASLILSNFIAIPVAPLFREQASPRKRDLVGTVVQVRTGRVDREFGNAEADNRGAGLLVEVRCEPGKLKRGDRALVIHYDAKLDAYDIEPLDEAMR